jgi:hypothetical protein
LSHTAVPWSYSSGTAVITSVVEVQLAGIVPLDLASQLAEEAEGALDILVGCTSSSHPGVGGEPEQLRRHGVSSDPDAASGVDSDVARACPEMCCCGPRPRRDLQERLGEIVARRPSESVTATV